MTNLLWLSLLPPITAFFVVGLVFVVIGFIVHYKIGQYYKFSADEVTRLTWERMNKRSGAALGLLVGGIYTVLVGMLIYVGGYLTTQVATENDHDRFQWQPESSSNLPRISTCRPERCKYHPPTIQGLHQNACSSVPKSDE